MSRPENVRNFLFVTIAPGCGGAYLVQRALHVRYGTKRDRRERPGVQGLLLHVLVDSIESYDRMDSYYLGLFYWCLCTQLAVCLLALLASQFSFILPLIFYSKYIDAGTRRRMLEAPPPLAGSPPSPARLPRLFRARLTAPGRVHPQGCPRAAPPPTRRASTASGARAS